jgi:hypothetical protein
LAEALKAHKLVTLTGVGGVGKTRLALEVGARLADEFRDGVFVIELAAVGSRGVSRRSPRCTPSSATCVKCLAATRTKHSPMRAKP